MAVTWGPDSQKDTQGTNGRTGRVVAKRDNNLLVEFTSEGTEIYMQLKKREMKVPATRCLKIRPEEYFDKFRK